jgi:hypothetical protein
MEAPLNEAELPGHFIHTPNPPPLPTEINVIAVLTEFEVIVSVSPTL